jgi:CPA1 family monovalent cation:H+ antiporter
VNVFDIAAVLLTIAAVTGYLNHRFLRLPSTSGTLAISLVSSLLILASDALVPTWELQRRVQAFLNNIDFNETLMRGLLSFLLFAGALHVDLDGLWRNKWTIGALSTLGVLTSTIVVGLLTWGMFRIYGMPIPLMVALVFGALISPTDPIAVMGLLRELLPRLPSYSSNTGTSFGAHGRISDMNIPTADKAKTPFGPSSRSTSGLSIVSAQRPVCRQRPC